MNYKLVINNVIEVYPNYHSCDSEIRFQCFARISHRCDLMLAHVWLLFDGAPQGQLKRTLVAWHLGFPLDVRIIKSALSLIRVAKVIKKCLSCVFIWWKESRYGLTPFMTLSTSLHHFSLYPPFCFLKENEIRVTLNERNYCFQTFVLALLDNIMCICLF